MPSLFSPSLSEVRRSVTGVEAGVDTAEEYRRKGYGRSAVAAWSNAANKEDLTVFYSTWWANQASMALAESLGFRKIGATLWAG